MLQLAFDKWRCKRPRRRAGKAEDIAYLRDLNGRRLIQAIEQRQKRVLLDAFWEVRCHGNQRGKTFSECRKLLASAKVESEQLCKASLQNKQILMSDLSKSLTETMTLVRDLLKRRILEAPQPLLRVQGPTPSLEQRKALALGALLNEKTRVDKRLVRAFRHWQKELLSRYLELLNERMRDAKKSVIVKRFKLIVSLMS